MTKMRTRGKASQGSSLDSFRGLLRADRDLFSSRVIKQSQLLFKAGRLHEVVQATAEYLVVRGIWLRQIPAAAGVREVVEPLARIAIATAVHYYAQNGGVVVARLGVSVTTFADACLMCWSSSFASPMPGPDIAMPEMDDPVVEARIVLTTLKAREIILEKAVMGDETLCLHVDALEGVCRSIATAAYHALTDADAVNHELIHGMKP